jgi:hypothetical protein
VSLTGTFARAANSLKLPIPIVNTFFSTIVYSSAYSQHLLSNPPIVKEHVYLVRNMLHRRELYHT